MHRVYAASSIHTMIMVCIPGLALVVTGCEPQRCGVPATTPPRPRYVRRLKILCDRLVVCGRILVGHAPFSDSASHPGLLGTSGESMSYTAAYRAISGALVDSSR